MNLGGAPIEVVETFSYLGAEIGLVERGGAGRGGKRRWCAVATVAPAKLEKAERRADWLATVANARFGLHPLIARDIIRAKSVTVALYGCEVLELADEERADVMLSKALHGALGTYARTHRWLVYSELGCPRVSSTARRMVLSGCARMMCSAAPIAPTLAAVVLSLRACGKWCSDDRRGRGGGLSGGRGSAVATGGDLLDAASDVSPRVLCELPYAKLLGLSQRCHTWRQVRRSLRHWSLLSQTARALWQPQLAAVQPQNRRASTNCQRRARHCDVYLPVVLARRGCACGHECRRRSPRCGSPLSTRQWTVHWWRPSDSGGATRRRGRAFAARSSQARSRARWRTLTRSHTSRPSAIAIDVRWCLCSEH